MGDTMNIKRTFKIICALFVLNVAGVWASEPKQQAAKVLSGKEIVVKLLGKPWVEFHEQYEAPQKLRERLDKLFADPKFLSKLESIIIGGHCYAHITRHQDLPDCVIKFSDTNLNPEAVKAIASNMSRCYRAARLRGNPLLKIPQKYIYYLSQPSADCYAVVVVAKFFADFQDSETTLTSELYNVLKSIRCSDNHNQNVRRNKDGVLLLIDTAIDDKGEQEFWREYGQAVEAFQQQKAYKQQQEQKVAASSLTTTNSAPQPWGNPLSMRGRIYRPLLENNTYFKWAIALNRRIAYEA